MTSSLASELTRKCGHIALGGLALSLRWLTPGQAALMVLAALLFNLFVLHPLTRRWLLREGERARGFSPGIVLYPAAVLALIAVFRSRLELAAAVWGLLAFGDGMATVAGLLVGGPRLPWNPKKTWAGLLAFVLNGTAAAAFLLRWTQHAVLDAGGARVAGHIGGSFIARSLDDAALPGFLFVILGCLAAALAAGLAESVDSGVDDNLLVPVVGGTVIFLVSLVRPGLLVGAAGLGAGLLWGAAINGPLAVGAYLARAVNLSGALWGAVLGTVLYALAGWPGFLMLALFVLLGTGATRLGRGKKAALGLAEGGGGRRSGRHALANCLTGVLAALLALATPYGGPFSLALVAAFATATCDTVSSEVGQAFGRRHYRITTFRRVRAGSEGAVSPWGTLAGIVATGPLAATAWWAGLIEAPAISIVPLAALIGATFESYLGAISRQRGPLDHELKNFANTVVGAAAAAALHLVLA